MFHPRDTQTQRKRREEESGEKGRRFLPLYFLCFLLGVSGAQALLMNLGKGSLRFDTVPLPLLELDLQSQNRLTDELRAGSRGENRSGDEIDTLTSTDISPRNRLVVDRQHGGHLVSTQLIQ
jgi:hypothetical protein